MSKATSLRTSTRTNPKSIGTKPREPSKDRNGIRKVNASSDNLVPSTTLKAKPSTSTTNLTKKVSKSDVNKNKLESHRNTTTSDKSLLKATSDKLLSKTKMPNTASKSSLSVTKTKKTAQETPPSSRVTKTQFFPSKDMYSNAVQEHLKTKPETSNNDRSATRTLNHSEVKLLKKKTETATKTTEKSKSTKNLSSDTERPRTATLKRGSIVNSNIAGPDIPISDTPSLTSLDLSYEQDAPDKDEDAYEDDFDSYESDFEEYHSSESTSLSSSDNNGVLIGEETTSSDTSSHVDIPKQSTSTGIDEERMFDSGNFDMPESKHKQLLGNIKEINEQENFTIENSRSNMASLSDEGFEEGKSSLQSGNMQFINFAGAQKKWKQNKNMEKRRKRGEEILNMIRLDHYNFTLIDIPPVSYDVFIKSYGKTNTIQVPTQTGDDDISEEIQTDDIDIANKWTQCPVTFSKIDENNTNYMQIYKREFLGVGDDYDAISNSAKIEDNINYKRLGTFLSFTSQIILTLLEESLENSLEGVHQNPTEMPFSKGYIKFDTHSCAILKNRPISFVTYCSMTNIKLLTVHGRKNKETQENDGDDLSFKSIVCIWTILNTKDPEKMMAVTGELSVCCCASEFRNLIFGGLYDGSVTIWDMGEDNWAQTLSGNINKDNHIQEPSYTTEISCGHSSRVVSIQPILNTTDSLVHNNFEWKSPNSQICSLDENGTLIIWGVIIKNNFSSFNIFTKQAMVAPWNRTSLVQNSKLSLKDLNPDLKDLQCMDMNINVKDPHHLFISTNYGYVVHCLVTGAKANPKRYNPGTLSQANCLEMCPFSPLYFFAGNQDGAIVLYSRLLEKPLMVMSNKEDTFQSSIQLLQWSYHKPCMFYAKDHHNTVHIWDLAISDLYPIYSILFKENITCMKLSPTLIKNNDTAYMMLASDSGAVHLHVLNSEHGPSNSEQYQQDMKKFLSYVNRL